MSQMKELYAKVASDSALQAKLAEIAKAPSEEKYIAFAKDAGFEVSIDDVKSYLDDSKKGDLSDDELDMVAGGKWDPLPVLNSVAKPASCVVSSALDAIDGGNCYDKFL